MRDEMRLVRNHHMFVRSDSIIDHQDKQGGSAGSAGRAERGTSCVGEKIKYFGWWIGYFFFLIILAIVLK